MAQHSAPCFDCGATKYKNRRGLCDRCYRRRKASGQPMPPSTVRTIAYHLARSQGRPDECWRWTGFIGSQGYGYHKGDGTFKSAHRIAYEHWVGPIPDGAEIDHTCHTNDPNCFDGDACQHRACVNPAHLELVTHEENVRRAHRPVLDRCQRGHELAGDNLYEHRGERMCRTCRRDYARERARRIYGRKPQVLMGTHCPSGHPLDEQNLHITPTGRRVCKVCRLRHSREWRAKQRALGRKPA